MEVPRKAEQVQKTQEDAPIVRSVDRGNRKARQIIVAARGLFLGQAYDSVSMDAVSRAADVSKATLYAHFTSKEALFAALINEECEAIANEVWPCDPALDDIIEALRRIARNFIAMFTTDNALALYRIIIAETGRFPVLGRAFYESGPRTLNRKLSAFLVVAEQKGLIAVPDPTLAAIQFISLIRGEFPVTGIMGLPKPTPAEVEASIEGGIRLFMAAYGTPAPGRSGS